MEQNETSRESSYAVVASSFFLTLYRYTSGSPYTYTSREIWTLCKELESLVDKLPPVLIGLCVESSNKDFTERKLLQPLIYLMTGDDGGVVDLEVGIGQVDLSIGDLVELESVIITEISSNDSLICQIRFIEILSR